MGLNITVGNYQIRKMEVGWQIYKYSEGGIITRGKHKGIISPPSWRAMGLFPNDIEYGVKLIINEYMKDVDGDVDIKDFNKYLEPLEHMIGRITCKIQDEIETSKK